MTVVRLPVVRAIVLAVVFAACSGGTGPPTATSGATPRISASPGGVPSDQRNFDRLYALLDPTFKRTVTQSPMKRPATRS